MVKIRHGLSMAYYRLGDGTSVPVPGAVRLDLDGVTREFSPESLNTFSEPCRYENIGYKGNFTCAGFPARFFVDIFGYELGDGVLTEIHTDGSPVPFSFLWENKGTGERFRLFKCFAGKPSINMQTDERSASVSTVTVPLYAFPDDNGHILANTLPGITSELYKNWFK